MPPSKHSLEEPREGSSSVKASASKRHATPESKGEEASVVPGGMKLPQELMDMIVEPCIHELLQQLHRACPDTCVGPPQAVATMISILRTSRSLYAKVSPLLYPQLFQHVELKRPSQLASFHYALFSKPWLRALVKSIVIGDINKLHGSMKPQWPVSLPSSSRVEGQRDFRITHGLQQRERDISPKWLSTGDEWSLGQEDNIRCCRDWFVLAAVKAAQEGLSADLSRPPQDVWAYSERSNKTDQYIIDCFRVQACLDLYLLEMRRIEDQERRTFKRQPSRRGSDWDSDCGPGKCAHYPRLQVAKAAAATGPPPSSSGVEPFVVFTHPEIDAHLARPGAATDCFNHPLLLARSGRRQWFYNEQRQRVSAEEKSWFVRATDPQALTMDPSTYNGIIGLVRSVLVMTQSAEVELWVAPLAESVEIGWHRRFVDFGKDQIAQQHWLRRRLAAEGGAKEEKPQRR